jgi:hypothetical protein
MKQSGESNLFFVDPMLAVPVDQLRAGNWIYEVKFDGYRAIAVKFDKEVRLLSRNRRVHPHPKAAANTSAPCLSDTTTKTNFFSPVVLALALQIKPWRLCTLACKRSSAQPAPL